MTNMAFKRLEFAEKLLSLNFTDDLNVNPLGNLKNKARKRFEKLGVPLNKDEYWRFMAPANFTSEKSANGLQSNRDSPYFSKEKDSINIYFEDGKLNESVSDLDELSGIEIVSLGDKEKLNIEWVQNLYGALEESSQIKVKRGLAAYNTACSQNGLLIRVVNSEEKIIIINYLGEKPNSDCLLHHIIKMENGSRITIIEQGEGCSRLNKVVEVDIGVKAELNHLRFFGADRKAHVLTQTFVRQATESVYREFAFTLNNEFVRNEFYISLEGEKAQVSLAGASLGEKNNIQDDTIFIAHLKPSCESRQVFKKVLKDGSTGVFQGKIFVSAEAQKTDGYQISKALLLGSESKFLTKPELEIYADDVICSHGSTCGAIDEESLFYLTSRGVSRNEATGMLVLAFLDEAIQEIADEKLALKVRNIFISQLEPNLE